MKALFLTALLVCTALVRLDAAAQSDAANVESLALAQAEVSRIQDQVSSFDMSLVEPLNSLADELMRIGEFDSAYRTLDRATQIVRINQGLFTQAQYPLLHKKVESLVKQGNWNDARPQLDYLVYLYTKKQEFATEELLVGFKKLSDTHLRAISEDLYEFQGFHFARVSASNWVALAIGEALWGKEDPRLVPLIYKVMSHFHLQYVAITRNGKTGMEIRSVAPGSNWVREVSDMRRYYLSAGVALIEQLKTIYSTDAYFDQEALAMADLYLADWLTLFNDHEQALPAYSKAYESLAAANVDQQRLELFFAAPRLLPESLFYPSLSLALESSTPRVNADSLAKETDVETETKVYFAEWSPSFPYVQQPLSLGVPTIDSEELAIFSFNIGGFPDITRLLKGRRPMGFGVVENLKALTDLPESSYQQRQLMNKVGSLRFRPKLVDGVPHETEATLVYALAGPN